MIVCIDFFYAEFWELIGMGEKSVRPLVPSGLHSAVWVHSFTGKGKGRISWHWEEIHQDITQKSASMCLRHHRALTGNGWEALKWNRL